MRRFRKVEREFEVNGHAWARAIRNGPKAKAVTSLRILPCFERV